MTSNNSPAARDRPFNPFRAARSDSARAAVAAVLSAVQAHEVHLKLRKRARRRADQETFERIVEALVCDLTHLELTQPGGWAAIPLSRQILSRKDRYRSPVLSKTLPNVVRQMASTELAFLVLVKGFHEMPSKADQPSRQSVIRPGARLLALIRESGLGLGDLGSDTHEELVVLRKKDAGTKKTSAIPYQDTPDTRMYRDQMQRINSWLAQADITFDPRAAPASRIDAQDRRLLRIFNNGSFQQGGRLYGGFWMPLPAEQRLRGTSINGSPVACIDFGQMAPRILYGMAGVRPDFEDAYKVPGLEHYRGTAKTVFNSMLHARSEHARFPSGSRQGLPRAVRVGEVIEAITTFHSPISGYFYAGRGMEVMFKESQILVDILLRLIDKGIVALPVHDALVISEDDVSVSRETMLEVFQEHTGLEGKVGVQYRD